MITRVPIHVQASKELSILENNFGARSGKISGSFKKPNPFITNVFPSNENFTGTKVIEGDQKTQFRIRPQTPKLDMILLKKAKRKQLTKIEHLPVKMKKVKAVPALIQKRKIKI